MEKFDLKERVVSQIVSATKMNKESLTTLGYGSIEFFFQRGKLVRMEIKISKTNVNRGDEQC